MRLLKSIANLLGGSTANDWNQLIADGAQVIDVRTRNEFKEGHFSKSKNIPLNELESKISQLNGKQVILVCRSGARASRAKRILEQSGVQAYNAGPWQTLNK